MSSTRFISPEFIESGLQAPSSMFKLIEWNNDSGKFTVKYVSIKYEYNGKDKTLVINLPWIVPKKTKSKIDQWLNDQIEKLKKK